MQIIDKPIVTEKSLALAETGVYTFAVLKTATTPEVAKAIAALYNVKVADVRVMTVHGQLVRRKTGIGRENNFKKALITLEKGQKIKAFEFEEKDEKKQEKKDKE